MEILQDPCQGNRTRLRGRETIDHISGEAFLQPMLCVYVEMYVCIINLGASNNKGVSLPGKLWERSKKIAWKGGGGYG